MAKTTLVIPCFNEAARLDVAAFATFLESSDGAAILFVDDGSTDGTRAVLEELCTRFPDRASALSLERNSGKAEAVRQGILSAMNGQPEYVGFWDADLATPLEDALVFSALMDGRPDIHAVIGSRVNLLGRSVRRNLLRHYVGRVFATAAAAVLRMGVYDTQCGAKLFRAGPAMKDVFLEPFLSQWIFDVEIIARMQRRFGREGLPRARECIYEFPLRVWRDVAGSKLRLRHFFTVAVDLIRILFRYSPKG
jgi:glycosyltransferase involved in cell wall biosynthesis